MIYKCCFSSALMLDENWSGIHPINWQQCGSSSMASFATACPTNYSGFAPFKPKIQWFPVWCMFVSNNIKEPFLKKKTPITSCWSIGFNDVSYTTIVEYQTLKNTFKKTYPVTIHNHFDTTYAEMHHENKAVLLLGTNFQIVMGMQHVSTNIGGQCWRQTKIEDPIFEVDVSLQV